MIINKSRTETESMRNHKITVLKLRGENFLFVPIVTEISGKPNFLFVPIMKISGKPNFYVRNIIFMRIC